MNRNAQLAERLRAEFPDFDDVLQNCTVPAIRRNKALWHAVRYAKNPPLEAYRLGVVARWQDQAEQAKNPKPKAAPRQLNRSRCGFNDGRAI
jgi:hypothetical protein